MAGERADPGPEHGHAGAPLDLAPGLEPAEPPLELGQPAVGVGGHGDLHHHPGGPVGVAGGHRVLEGRLGKVVGGAPLGRPPGQLHGQAGLAALELAAEQLQEQPVEPVPLPAPVQRRGQEAGPGQGLEQVGRPGGGQHGVAEGAGHAVQHRAAGQERHQPLREAGEQLELQVVDQDPVVTGQGDRPGGAAAPAPAARTAKCRATGQPSVRRTSSATSTLAGSTSPNSSRSWPRRRPSPGPRGRPPPPAPRRAVGPAAGAARPGWRWPAATPREVVDQPGHGVQAVQVLQQVDVVEHDHGRQLGPGQGGPEPRRTWSTAAAPRARPRPAGRPRPARSGRGRRRGSGAARPGRCRAGPPSATRRPAGRARPTGPAGSSCHARRGDDGRHRGAAGGLQEVEEADPRHLGVGSELGVQLGRERQDGLPGHRYRPTSVAGTRATMRPRPAGGIIQMG